MQTKNFMPRKTNINIRNISCSPPACVHAQSWPTLWDPMDCSPPDFSFHGISRQEHWSGLPFPAPGYIPNPGIEPTSLAPPVLTGRFFLLLHLGSPSISCISRWILRILFLSALLKYLQENNFRQKKKTKDFHIRTGCVHKIQLLVDVRGKREKVQKGV